MTNPVKTLRDEIAIAVMQSLLTRDGLYNERYGQPLDDPGDETGWLSDSLTKTAYCISDDMLEARKEKK